MIRRAFLRRMAHAAMAGMLGVELMVRAPTVISDSAPPQGVAWQLSEFTGVTDRWVCIEEVWDKRCVVLYVDNVEVYRAARDTGVPTKFTRWFAK